MRDHHVKLDRARELLEELKQEVDARRNLCEASIRHLASEDRRTHRYVVTDVPHVDVLAALAGDVAHNARTALDHLAWAIASKHHVTSERLGFPVLAKAPTTLDELMPDAPAEVLRALDSEQPYRLGEGHISPLMIVHELNRIDKHRILLPAIFTVENASWGIPDGNPLIRRDVAQEPLTNGATLATLLYEHPIEDPGISLGVQMRLHPRIEREARVPEGYLTRGSLQGWALGIGVFRVGRVVEHLDRFL